MSYAPFPESLIGFRAMWICDRCGALVVDTAIHDRFHAGHPTAAQVAPPAP